MQKLEDLSVKMLEYNLVDMPDTAVLGINAYVDLQKELVQIYGGPLPIGSMRNFSVYTSAANLKVLVSSWVHPDHVSIGSLGIETFKLLETFGRLGIKHEDPFKFGFTY